MKIKKAILYFLILLSLAACNGKKASNQNIVTCSTTNNALYTALGTPEGCK